MTLPKVDPTKIEGYCSGYRIKEMYHYQIKSTYQAQKKIFGIWFTFKTFDTFIGAQWYCTQLRLKRKHRYKTTYILHRA